MKIWNISGRLRRFFPSSFPWRLLSMHLRTLFPVRIIYLHISNFVFSLPIHHFLYIMAYFLSFFRPLGFSPYYTVILINEEIEIVGLNEIHECCFRVILSRGLRAEVDKSPVYDCYAVIFKVKRLWKYP